MAVLRNTILSLPSILVAWAVLGHAAGVLAQQQQPESNRSPAKKDLLGDPLPPGAIARLGTIRFQHPEPTLSLAFSADGKVLVSAGKRFIYLWDVALGKALRRIEPGAEIKGAIEPDGEIKGVALAPDGRTVAATVSGFTQNGNTVSLWEQVCLWDVATGKVLRQFGEAHRMDRMAGLAALAFSPDGKTLAAGASHGRGSIWLWDVTTGREVRPPFGQFGVSRLAFLPGGKKLAVVRTNPSSNVPDLTGSIYDLKTEEGEFGFQVGRGAEDPRVLTRILAFAPDGGAVASITAPGWNLVRNLIQNTQVRLTEPAQGVALAPEGAILATSVDEHDVTLWDTATGKLLRKLEGTRGSKVMAFSPDGKVLALASGWIRLWDVVTGKELPQSQRPRPGAWVTFSPDGKNIATEFDGRFGLWDLAGQRQYRTLATDRGERLVGFAPDEKSLLTLGTWDAAPPKFIEDGLRWRDIVTGKEIARLAGLERNDPVTLSPDGRLLAQGTDASGGPVRLWDLTARKPLPGPGALKSATRCLAFSPDNGLLACGQEGEENKVYLWDITAGKALPPLTPSLPSTISKEQGVIHYSVSFLQFLPDSRTLALKAEAGVTLWDVRSRQRVLQVEGRRALPSSALALSPDGRFLASLGDQRSVGGTTRKGPGWRTVTLWETATGGKAREFAGHAAEILFLAFAPDGRSLASTSADGTALLWDVLPAAREGEGRPDKGLSTRDLDRLWDDLAAKDAATAYAAMRRLIAAPDAAVASLGQRLSPSEAVAPEQLRRLLADLDDDQFRVRQEARDRFAELNTQAEPALREALRGILSPEQRRSIESLLEALPVRPLRPAQLRAGRAVQILEYIRSAEARGLVARLAKGHPAAPQTREAEAALQRLKVRQDR